MSIKPKDQLTDSGAIIGYRPDLQYSKNINSFTNQKTKDIITEDSKEYSKTIESYLANQPSTVIIDLIDTVNSIDDSIKRLTEEFDKKDNDKYSNLTAFVNAIENNNLTYVNEFLSYHKDNIERNQIPEITYTLEQEKQRLNIMIDTLKTLYYGTASISEEECKSKDESLALIISDMDIQKNGLNYLTLSYDSKLNKSISIYSSKVNASTLQLEEVGYITDDTDVTNKLLLNNINRLFFDVNDEINDRTATYNIQQSVDTMRKTLYNYYNKRNNLKNYYDIVISSAAEGSYLITKITDYDNETNEAINEVNKSNLGNVYYLDSLQDLMIEKQHLRSLYATISYN